MNICTQCTEDNQPVVWTWCAQPQPYVHAWCRSCWANNPGDECTHKQLTQDEIALHLLSHGDRA